MLVTKTVKNIWHTKECVALFKTWIRYKIPLKQCGIKFLQNTTYDVYIYDTDTNNEIYR